MTIQNKPTIYNVPTVYNTGAGGGGGIPPYIDINGENIELKNYIFLKTPSNNLGRVAINVIFNTACYYDFELLGLKPPASQVNMPLFKSDQNENIMLSISERSGFYCDMNSYHSTNGRFVEYFSPLTLDESILYKVRFKEGGIIWNPSIGNSAGSGIFTNYTFTNRSFTKITLFEYGLGNRFNGKIKNLKIFDNADNMLLNIIPAYNTTTGKPGVVDLITLKFYPATSTGDVNEYIGVE